MHSIKSNRGSVLIVALLFAGLIAISLTSYMKLALTSSRLANRSFYGNAAQNLSDTGLEQALWSINNNTWTGTAGFTARSGYANQYQGTFPSSTTYYTFSQGVKGQVKVWADNNSTTPHAVAKAIITLGDGTTLIKEAEAYLSKRSYFTNGLVAKNTLTFVGNVAIDSWNSKPAGTVVPYSSSVDADNGKIASLSVQVASISVGNADVYGYASVGGNSIADISVGSTGRVGPYGTANGVIDPTRVTYDFTTNFPDVTPPTTSGYTIAAITSATTLPISGNLPAADGKYYYSVPSITLNGHDTISITAGADVVITVTNTTGTSVQASGNSEIDIPSTSTLAMYVAADVSMTGNGVVNGTSTVPNQPLAFQLYGTRSATTAASVGQQAIAIKGNGYLSGVVYAPNANVDVNGNGDTYGAIVCNQASMNGNGNFHYDESLATSLSTSAWSVSKWRELSTASDRNTYATNLNF
ncbi:MAG TPA: hypothetical protein VL357_11310 [Rariglobus sp.]|jgi:Tfp pilus assembly protein PilX|nr:hypothetical protein [Rariglobus sp.]